jgi:YVTN family beta-propeller protein
MGFQLALRSYVISELTGYARGSRWINGGSLGHRQVALVQRKHFVLAGAVLVGCVLIALTLAPSQSEGVVVTSPLIPTGWTLTPYGTQSALGGLPLGIAATPDGSRLLVTNDGLGINNGIDHQSLMYVDAATGKVLQEIVPKPNSLFVGVAFAPDGSAAYASGGGSDRILKYRVGDTGLTLDAMSAIPPPPGPAPEGGIPTTSPAGIAVSADGSSLLVVGSIDASLHILKTSDLKETAVIPVGRPGAFFPYSVVPGSGSIAYVGGWGAKGSPQLFQMDLQTGQVRTLPSGDHPTALTLSADGRRLFVANADSDTVTVLDVQTHKVVRSMAVAPSGTLLGASPTSLALSKDGHRLYVADAGLNAVAVLDPTASSPLLGMIPTGWYPTALAITAGDRLSVVNAKGTGSGPNLKGPVPIDPNRTLAVAGIEYVGSMIRGSLSTFAAPDSDTLKTLTAAVTRNDRLGRSAGVASTVVPAGRGQSSPIKHVIYIVKENRTYDQVLGDLPHGNGDPALAIFGNAITPNQHKLANDFITIDNFYADAETTAAGHYWATAATATAYVEKTWPQNYSNRGAFPQWDPVAFPDSGFLWDAAFAAGLSYRDYGEFTPLTQQHLQGHSDPNIPPVDFIHTDQERVDEWAKEFQAFGAAGALPQLEILRLPNDHTVGTRPGALTPQAMVADNDLAVGRVVDIVSHSQYWKDTAIFITEDDAQDGRDHVDAHRTLALVVSAYSHLGRVDHTQYDTASMLRTIELILGLSPMTEFDAVATPMRGSFGSGVDMRPYSALQPDVPTLRNTDRSPGARISMTLDFSAEDRNQGPTLESILYLAARVDSGELAVVRAGHR